MDEASERGKSTGPAVPPPSEAPFAQGYAAMLEIRTKELSWIGEGEEEEGASPSTADGGGGGGGKRRSTRAAAATATAHLRAGSTASASVGGGGGGEEDAMPLPMTLEEGLACYPPKPALRPVPPVAHASRCVRVTCALPFPFSQSVCLSVCLSVQSKRFFET